MQRAVLFLARIETDPELAWPGGLRGLEESALAALERFLAGFAPESVVFPHANYHLTVASHWRSASATASSPRLRGNHDVQ